MAAHKDSMLHFLASRDLDADAEAALVRMIDEREEELASGEMVAVSVDVAIARLEARFPG